MMKTKKKIKKCIVASMLTICTISSTIPSVSVKAQENSHLLSLNRPAYASSINGGDVATRATDGDVTTQWGANWETSNQWLDVDLGAGANIDKVIIKWQNPMTYAKKYKIMVSDDELNWTTVYTNANGTGGTRVPDSNGNPYCVEELALSGSGRYVRLFAEECVSGYGISVYEFEVYGTGGANPIQSDAPNLALNKSVTASSTEQPWWASSGEKAAEKAVDGNKNTNWLSKGSNNEWFQVDLGQVYKIGEVDISWEVEFGRIFEIQTSEDGANWKTVYRQIHGMGEDEKVSLYENARYVRMNGIAMGRGSGYSIREFKVYEYVEGNPKISPAVTPLPEASSVQVGSGSYAIDDVTMAQPRYPKYITKNVKTPIPSNDWWTSIVYTRLSDGVVASPLMFKYEDTGLGLYYTTDLFTSPNNGGMDTKSNNMDLIINASNITGTPSAKVDGYGDWSVDTIFSDDDTPKLRSTLVKGSPYVYNTFSDPNSVEISAQSIIGLFDDNNNAILAKDGDSITIDHIGIETSNTNTAPTSKKQVRSYGIFAPEGTVFTRLGSKIKIKLGNGQNYLSVGALTSKSDLNYMYKHAYAFVKNTTVKYDYDAKTSNVTTNFTDTISLKRDGFSSDTLMALFPHQWKYTDNDLTDVTYESARGEMKVLEGNSFKTIVKFQGITPSFGEPVESSTYNKEKMIEYLNKFKKSITNDYFVADPYWQGKKTHPLAMGILIAEQLGDYETRDEFIRILRKILENWFTYSGKDDYPYYMYYSSSWGTLNGDGGDHGMGMNLSDHHFLWSYFTFPAAVLASYDSDFKGKYGGMVEQLIRDSVNPSKTDELYPFMRNFDPYEAHSWAGGYGDNQSGNNQESSSEATFAWAGLYLWGLVTNNDTYKDAGIWGYTSEVNAIEQYWFNYDQDNWADDYTSGCVGMVWGSAYTNGTYFSGNPSCIYGIHMLPVTPALTYLGYKPEVAKRIYEAYQKDQEKYQRKVAAEGKSDPEGWFHILWPYESLSDPNAVMAKWNESLLPDDEIFNSYWFIQNMSAKGHRAIDVWSNNYTSYEVFKKDSGEYSAVIWNPYNEVKYVEFENESGKTGSAYVLPHSTLNVNPFKENPMPDPSTAPPLPGALPSPSAIPGKIEAEDYYTNFGCNKVDVSEGGSGIGFISKGDSLIYNVNVAEEGDYKVAYRVKNGSNHEGKLKIQSDISGSTVLTAQNIPNNNGEWTTVRGTIHLAAGAQKLKVVFDEGDFDLNWLKFYTGDEPEDSGNPENPNDLPESKFISLNKSASVSSQIGGNTGANVTDGDKNTRWESEHSDPQWISIDLESDYNIEGVKLNWEVAAGKDYKVQVSEYGKNWADAYTKTNGTGGAETDIFKNPVKGRYVRVYGTARTTGYGYSLWEFKVYGSNVPAEQKLISSGKSVTASSHLGGNTEVNITDGNKDNTRWESEYSDPQWICINLESDYNVTGVKLNWETAAGKDYKIQVSEDGENWVDAYAKTNGTGGNEDITFDNAVKGRYVRMYGTARTTGYGYSLWEFEVYGTN